MNYRTVLDEFALACCVPTDTIERFTLEDPEARQLLAETIASPRLLELARRKMSVLFYERFQEPALTAFLEDLGPPPPPPPPPPPDSGGFVVGATVVNEWDPPCWSVRTRDGSLCGAFVSKETAERGLEMAQKAAEDVWRTVLRDAGLASRRRGR
jgi:hypothetical protein